MKKRQTIIAALVLALLLLIGGAIAYFTDTDSKENKFTLGKVDIELLEPSFVEENAKDLVPGASVAKDPQIKNKGKNDAYVFLKVSVDCAGTRGLFTYEVNDGWTLLEGSDSCQEGDGKIQKVYYYGSGDLAVLGKGETSGALFDRVTLVTDLVQAEADAINLVGDPVLVNVEAFGIQADGLTAPVTPAAVWANFASQNGGSNG